jgi:hypothetical protein
MVTISLQGRDSGVTSVSDGGDNLMLLSWRGRQNKTHAVSQKMGCVREITTCCEVRAHLRKEAPPGRRVASTKDGAHWNAEKFHEDKGKNNGKIRVIEHAMKGCVHVVTELKDIFLGMRDPQIPDPN